MPRWPHGFSHRVCPDTISLKCWKWGTGSETQSFPSWISCLYSWKRNLRTPSEILYVLMVITSLITWLLVISKWSGNINTWLFQLLCQETGKGESIWIGCWVGNLQCLPCCCKVPGNKNEHDRSKARESWEWHIVYLVQKNFCSTGSIYQVNTKLKCRSCKWKELGRNFPDKKKDLV